MAGRRRRDVLTNSLYDFHYRGLDGVSVRGGMADGREGGRCLIGVYVKLDGQKASAGAVRGCPDA